MLKTKNVTRLLGLMLTFCLSYEAYPRTPAPADDPSANWPKVLLKEVDDVARDYVSQRDDVLAANSLVVPISTNFNTILVYAIADAITKGDVSLRTLEAHQYMGETARTDKQIGSSPSAGGSTSAIEKPGIPYLIGLAIDRGSIQQAVNGTSLTLSTSPYALAALSEGDTAATYQRFGALRAIGVSATYTITDDSQLLSNLHRKQLDQFSVRLRLSKDRSTRSDTFKAMFDKDIAPKIQRRLIVITKEQADTFVNDRQGNRKVNDWRRKLRVDLHAAIKGQLATLSTAASDTDKNVAAIKKTILDFLQREIYDKNPTDLGFTDTDLKRVKDEFIPNLVAAHEDLVNARGLLQTAIDELNNKWLVTLTYTNHPVEMGPGYSEFRLVGEHGITAPLKFTFNVEGSIYHKPDPLKNQERFKGFDGAFSLEYSVTPRYLKDTVDMGKITYAMTGSYQRIQENRNVPMMEANIGIAQFKASFPISNGVSIPLSVTYATATALIKEDHVRGNFGISFDLDKFAALAKLRKP